MLNVVVVGRQEGEEEDRRTRFSASDAEVPRQSCGGWHGPPIAVTALPTQTQVYCSSYTCIAVMMLKACVYAVKAYTDEDGSAGRPRHDAKARYGLHASLPPSLSLSLIR